MDRNQERVSAAIVGKMKSGAVMLAAAVLCGCRSSPDYPVPRQSPTFENFKPPTGLRVVDLSQPGAGAHIVRDILGDFSLPWRWTLQRPAVEVRIGFDRHLNYVIDFTIPEVTFKDTGPVTLAFTVNDRLLDRVRYASPGSKHFEQPVPPDWIAPHSDVVVGAEIDKTRMSNNDGARLGFILSRIGLVER